MKFCPILNRECLGKQCVWFNSDEIQCAVTCIAASLDQIAVNT